MSTEQNTILTKNLIRIRSEKRFSQREISAILGISQPSYNRVEAGTASMNAERLHLLAEFYMMQMDDFFSESPGTSYSAALLKQKIFSLENKIKDIETINNILQKRNSELEEKLKRKDKKIDALMKENSEPMIR